jgi:hypothetical protein
MEYKLLVANLYSLWKHAGHCKTLVAMPRVKVGGHYYLKPNAHVPNEKLYFAKGLKTMLQHVIHGAIQFFDKRKKIVQFPLIFHLLSHNRPLIEYTTM